MGTGSKSSHASYAVGPTAASEADDVLAEAPEQAMSDEEIQAKADLLMAVDNIEALSNLGPDSWAEAPSPDPVVMYDLFVEEVEKA
ncbi:hypothetical protein ABT072_48245, partial [Streptomyces sp. NPDC002589]|uniref:hypothetical protein n=1 Tax=Streptomyces sp. NPDC002589 TaxID=3154420 RepID=UPI00332C0D55